MNILSRTALGSISAFLIGLNVATAQDAMFVDSTGNVGVGTNTPVSPLHVFRTDGTSELLVEEGSGSVARRNLVTLLNNGEPKFVLSNTNSGETWDFSARTNGFNINLLGTGGSELRIAQNGLFEVGSGGNANFSVFADGKVFMTNDVRVEGTLVHSSSRAVKKAIRPVDHQVVLDKLEQLEIAEWTYRKDSEGHRHLSPMAENFYAAFGLGPNDKYISSSDLAGVALAAAKALRQRTAILEAENERLRARLDELDSVKMKVEALERRLSRILSDE